MPEITLRDLCRWDRRLEIHPPTGYGLDASLDRGVSWVVSVRATPPLLPPLRGDELVVLTRRVADKIEEAQMMDWRQLLNMLASQRISALLTEPALAEEPLERLPIITMPAPFPQDAEGTLNRLLTERRAELYRLGNELSRRLSQAVIDPHGVAGILDVAAEVCGRPIALQDSDGLLVARGGEGKVDLASAADLETASQSPGPSTIGNGYGRECLIVQITNPTGTTYMTISAPSGMLTEVDRLVLTQTAGTVAIMLAQGEALGVREARQQALTEILEGRLWSETSITARSRGMGIDPTHPVRVGLITRPGEGEQPGRVVEQLIGGLRGAERTEIEGVIAILVAESEFAAFDQRLARVAARRMPSSPLIAVSDAVPTIADAAAALRQARYVLGLMKAGVIDRSVVRADSLDDIGVFGLLYHLWGNPAVDDFRRDVLGELEAYDERRGSDLIESLRAYLSSGGSLAEAAAALGVHRNTLSYRINRIAELSGRDLNSPHDRLLFRVALFCRDLAQVDEE